MRCAFSKRNPWQYALVKTWLNSTFYIARLLRCCNLYNVFKKVAQGRLGAKLLQIKIAQATLSKQKRNKNLQMFNISYKCWDVRKNVGADEETNHLDHVCTIRNQSLFKGRSTKAYCVCKQMQ